jgi:menaquinone-dependent protoporphyrinogen IX oxidase
MRAVVVYESMFGNTHAVADAIGRGLSHGAEVAVIPVTQATPDLVAAADLLVVGGPTHVHGMSRASTRRSAAEMADKQEALHLEPNAVEPGLREWFDSLPDRSVAAAAFDTRMDGPAFFTGRAAKGIGKRLRRHHCVMTAKPQSFMVTKQNTLHSGETARAEAWGKTLVESNATMTVEASIR